MFLGLGQRSVWGERVSTWGLCFGERENRCIRSDKGELGEARRHRAECGGIKLWDRKRPVDHVVKHRYLTEGFQRSTSCLWLAQGHELLAKQDLECRSADCQAGVDRSWERSPHPRAQGERLWARTRNWWQELRREVKTLAKQASIWARVLSENGRWPHHSGDGSDSSFYLLDPLYVLGIELCILLYIALNCHRNPRRRGLSSRFHRGGCWYSELNDFPEVTQLALRGSAVLWTCLS